MNDLTSEDVQLAITARPPVGVDVLRAAAGRWAEGTIIQWCEYHNAEMTNTAKQECWDHEYWHPCRIVERRLCE